MKNRERGGKRRRRVKNEEYWWNSSGMKRLRALYVSHVSVMFLSIGARCVNEALRSSIEFGVFNDSWCNLEVSNFSSSFSEKEKLERLVSRAVCVVVSISLSYWKRRKSMVVSPGEREHDLRGIREFKLHWVALATSEFFVAIIAMISMQPKYLMRIIAFVASCLSYCIGFIIYQYRAFKDNSGMPQPEERSTVLIVVSAMCSGASLYAAIYSADGNNKNNNLMMYSAPPIIPDTALIKNIGILPILSLARIALSIAAFFCGLFFLDLVDKCNKIFTHSGANEKTHNNFFGSERLLATSWAIAVSFLLANVAEHITAKVITAPHISTAVAVGIYILPSLFLVRWFVHRAENAQECARKAIEHVRTGRLDTARRRRDLLDQRLLLLNDGLALGFGRLVQMIFTAQICASDQMVRLARLVLLWILAIFFIVITPWIYAFLARLQAAILKVDELSISNSFNSLDTAIWNPANFAPTIDDDEFFDGYGDDDGIEDDFEFGSTTRQKKERQEEADNQEARIQAAIDSGHRFATSPSVQKSHSASPLYRSSSKKYVDSKEEETSNHDNDDATCSDDYNFLRTTLPPVANTMNDDEDNNLATPMSATQADLW